MAVSSIFLVSSSWTFGKAIKDWTLVESLANQEVAIKTNGGMKYGIVKSVDSDSLVLQLADKKRLTQDESTINKSDIKKIWRATLFVNKRRVGKGALIGAGVGIGVGLVSLQTDAAQGDGQAGIVVLPLAVIGAGVGGFVGFFAKKKHKKRDLVYKW